MLQPGEQEIPVAPANQRDAAVLLRQDAAGEQKQIGCDFLRFERPAAKLQNAAHLGRIREVRERSEIQFPPGLPHALAAHEAPAPRPALLPHHRAADTVGQIVELQLGLARRIGEPALSAGGEARKQRGRRMRADASTGRRIRRRAREQHGGLAAPVRTGNHGHRVVERHPQVANPAQVAQPDLVEKIVRHLLPRPQRVPGLPQRRIKDGHSRARTVSRRPRTGWRGDRSAAKSARRPDQPRACVRTWSACPR